MNSFTIQANALPDEKDDVTAYLTQLLAPNTDNYNLLKYEIQREYRFSGSPDITNMKYDRVKFDAASGKGSFRVVLDINFTFACEDIRTEKTDQTSEWTFEINKDTHTVTFYASPYIDSRSTADEF
ncbi:hypothetical protein KHS38_04935 [Mucilaginibacter sp. Bleaf8]|uniref:hypothetical protein n=1 Tax=Mucilaginibacter sp. Bleaf8 TaxID=2834430 RepID=UPI001BCCBBDB|nr:hypothetical protein [Mucilaginibacter sp. Bleaf8]MBS7563740.1 hypothetical protein [Mucilaginibacter sp. Bleaf8]